MNATTTQKSHCLPDTNSSGKDRIVYYQLSQDIIDIQIDDPPLDTLNHHPLPTASYPPTFDNVGFLPSLGGGIDPPLPRLKLLERMFPWYGG